MTLIIGQLSLAAVLFWPLTGLYILLLVLIAVYGLHRYWLVYLYRRHGQDHPEPTGRFDTPPRVTVQLPMFNEGLVAARIIDAAAMMDYRADRLQIQVIDDSDDHSRGIVDRRVAHWQAEGLDVQLCRRENRHGFKAGALGDASPQVTGELVAIFDADFVPPRDFLTRTVDYFTDDHVGMVQTRWDHLNRQHSCLTRCQAVLIDGHFVIEQGARSHTGRWFHFNGTAGIWRRAAIEQAGGWTADTLAEDLDLSIRAQMLGWKFLFAPQIGCPAELPPTVPAYKTQQHRWAKGTTQACRKHLWRVLGAPVPWRVKGEVMFQLSWPIAASMVTLATLLYFPAFFIQIQPWSRGSVNGGAIGMVLLTLGIVSTLVFYTVSQTAIKRSGWKMILFTPMMISMGVGVALTNGRGVFEALIGHRSGFVRTPKYCEGSEDASAGSPAEDDQYRTPWGRYMVKLAQPGLELLIATYLVLCIGLAMDSTRSVISIPLLVLFALGYLWFGMASVLGFVRQLPAFERFYAKKPAPAPAPGNVSPATPPRSSGSTPPPASVEVNAIH